MKYSDMTEEQLDACAELLGNLMGTVSNLPRRDVGEHNSLALAFAYGQVSAMMVTELRALAEGSN